MIIKYTTIDPFKKVIWMIQHLSRTSIWRLGPLIGVVGVEAPTKAWLVLIDREGSYYNYLPLTPRISLPPPSQWLRSAEKAA